MLLSNMGVQVMDAEDGMESHQYTFGGLADCYKNFIMDICGAAEIPATRLFGRSPEGMNATGESDLQNYYEMITKNQESTLRPILNKLLPVLCMSILGAVPDDLDYEFNPVRQPSDEDLVDLAKAGTENVIQAYNAGLVSQRTALLELKQQSERTGIWTNITDADIEAANDQVEQPGEMGGDMAAMMGGEGGNPQGGPEQSNGGPSAGQETPRVPQAKTPGVKTPEVKTPNPGAKDSYPFSVKDDDEFESKHPRDEGGKFDKENSLSSFEETLGPLFDGVQGQAAVNKLLSEKKGHVINAFHRGDIGGISLFWGDDNFGLKHIIKSRQDSQQDIQKVLASLTDVIENGNLTPNISTGRVQIKKNGIMAIVSPTLFDRKFTFVVTAFEIIKK